MGVISWVYITEAGMRTLVDLPERELAQLTALSRSRKTSRAELIRQAVTGYLAQNRAGLEDSFGLWKDRGVDGLEYQDKLREEWER
jgi:metal-responsive CopG/Arc/MetJ family transcriptional regulator